MNSLEEKWPGAVQYRGEVGKKKRNERSSTGEIQLGANEAGGNVARRGAALG